MKKIIGLLLVILLSISCNSDESKETVKSPSLPITGTWKLLTGTLVEKGDTTITDYTQNKSFHKIINDTHFAFFMHDTNKGKDSTATFSSGGGSYTLTDSIYTEHLEYCTAREWEGNDFTFTMTIKGDTLIQRGIEVIESEGINRLNIEKYIRIK